MSQIDIFITQKNQSQNKVTVHFLIPHILFRDREKSRDRHRLHFQVWWEVATGGIQKQRIQQTVGSSRVQLYQLKDAVFRCHPFRLDSRSDGPRKLLPKHNAPNSRIESSVDLLNIVWGPP